MIYLLIGTKFHACLGTLLAPRFSISFLQLKIRISDRQDNRYTWPRRARLTPAANDRNGPLGKMFPKTKLTNALF